MASGFLMSSFIRNLLWINSLEGLRENLKIPRHDLLNYGIPKSSKYANNEKATASYLYDGKYGNKYAGDGYRYIGRGYIKCRGRAHYQYLTDYYGLDFINRPEMLEERHIAYKVAKDMYFPFLDEDLIFRYYPDEIKKLGLELKDIPQNV